jgi:hypothetical protein
MRKRRGLVYQTLPQNPENLAIPNVFAAENVLASERRRNYATGVCVSVAVNR